MARGRPASITGLQARIGQWVLRTFGGEIATNVEERSMRVVEEALEIAQCAMIHRERLHALVDRVYSRPVGHMPQEIAGVGVTLLALGECVDVDVNKAIETELRRIDTPQMRAKIRAKQNDKAAAGVAMAQAGTAERLPLEGTFGRAHTYASENAGRYRIQEAPKLVPAAKQDEPAWCTQSAPSTEREQFDPESFYTEFRCRLFGDGWREFDAATNHEHVEALEATVAEAKRRLRAIPSYAEWAAQQSAPNAIASKPGDGAGNTPTTERECGSTGEAGNGSPASLSSHVAPHPTGKRLWDRGNWFHQPIKCETLKPDTEYVRKVIDGDPWEFKLPGIDDLAAQSSSGATPWDRCEFQVIAWEIDQGEIGIAVKHENGGSAWAVEPNEHVRHLLRDGLRYRFLRGATTDYTPMYQQALCLEAMDEWIDKQIALYRQEAEAKRG